MQTAKTPVSILQEMMVRMGQVPEYELIHDGGGTHDNTFTYKVSCDGCSATGTGRCKKDAKHLAAKNVLEQIALKNNFPQLPATPGESPVHEPELTLPDLTSNTFHNAVGALQTFCADNNLELPKYVLVNDQGPPHAKVFIYQCIVSDTFKEEGRAKTKKQAKHEAAEKMLRRLKQVVTEMDSNLLSKLEVVKEDDDEDMSEKAAKYVELTKLNPRKNCLGVKLSEYHVRWKHLFTDDERKDVLIKLNKLLRESNKTEKENYKELVELMAKGIEEALTAVNVSVNVLGLDSKKEGLIISTAQIVFGPDIVEMAADKEKKKADYVALQKALNNLIKLLT